jgi:hypothetical protein
LFTGYSKLNRDDSVKKSATSGAYAPSVSSDTNTRGATSDTLDTDAGGNSLPLPPRRALSQRTSDSSDLNDSDKPALARKRTARISTTSLTKGAETYENVTLQQASSNQATLDAIAPITFQRSSIATRKRLSSASRTLTFQQPDDVDADTDLEPATNYIDNTTCEDIGALAESDSLPWWCFSNMSRHVAEKILEIEGKSDGLFLLRTPIAFDSQFVSPSEEGMVKLDVCYQGSITRLLIDIRNFQALFANFTPSDYPYTQTELATTVATCASSYAPCKLIRSCERIAVSYAVANTRATCGFNLARSRREHVDWVLRQAYDQHSGVVDNGSYCFWEDISCLGWYGLSVFTVDPTYGTCRTHHYRCEAAPDAILLYYDASLKDVKAFATVADLVSHHSMSEDGLVSRLVSPVHTLEQLTLHSEPIVKTRSTASGALQLMYDSWPLDSRNTKQFPIANVSRAAAIKLLHEKSFKHGLFVIRYFTPARTQYSHTTAFVVAQSCLA